MSEITMGLLIITTTITIIITIHLSTAYLSNLIRVYIFKDSFSETADEWLNDYKRMVNAQEELKQKYNEYVLTEEDIIKELEQDIGSLQQNNTDLKNYNNRLRKNNEKLVEKCLSLDKENYCLKQQIDSYEEASDSNQVGVIYD